MSHDNHKRAVLCHMISKRSWGSCIPSKSVVVFEVEAGNIPLGGRILEEGGLEEDIGERGEVGAAS